MKGHIRDVATLKSEVKNCPINDFAPSLGFADADAMNIAIDDFYNKFGEFAISLGYDHHTGKLAIYINTSKGSHHDIVSHPLVTKIAASMSPHLNKIYYYTSKDIKDSWVLKREAGIGCNTPLLFIYILGTEKVEYD